MKKTETFRQHHRDIRAIVARIEALTRSGPATLEPEAVAAVVRELFGKFSTHLAIEDKTLYPKAVAHTDPRLRDTAVRFQTEMGGLGERFDRYKRDWAGPIAISRDPSAFLRETAAILDLLKARIDREERDLYALIDEAA